MKNFFLKKSEAKVFFSILLLIIMLGIAGGLYNIQIEKKGGENKVPILNKYEKKIVYTTNTNKDTEKFKTHCRKEGGEFNKCGSICGKDSKICVEVCAYTCEFNYKKY